MKMFTLPSIISILIIFSTGLFAQTTSVLPVLKDNSMFDESGTKSLGDGNIFAGKTCNGAIRRALVQFDVSAIPSGATVTNVELLLGAEKSRGMGDGVIDIFAVTLDWGEGTSSASGGGGNGGTAVAPDATWTDAMLGTSSWNTVGGDFNPALLSTRVTTEEFQTISFPSSENFNDQVEAWVANPSTNFGIIIIGVEDTDCSTYRFGSKEEGTAPELVVTWDDQGCQPTVTDLSIQACDTYISPAGFIYDMSSSFSEVIAGSNGCDSIFNIDLLIFETDQTFINGTLCDGQTYTLEGIVFDQNNPSGTVTYTSVNGCDSLFIIDLEFLPSINVEINETFCEGSGGSVVVNGTIYGEDNPIGCELLEQANGCDSIVCVNLTYLPTSSSLINDVLCMDDTIVINGTFYDKNNPQGTELLVGFNGCDSIVMIDLVFNSPATSEEEFLTCDPSVPPITTVTISNGAFNGCDSFINLVTVYLPIDETDIFIGSCDPINVGTETFVLTNQSGCDSIVTITTTLLPSDTTDIFEVSCHPSDTGFTITNLINEFGCDSIVRTSVSLEVLDNSVTLDDLTFTASLAGASYQWIDCENNNTPIIGETQQSIIATTSGAYAVEITQNGCTVTSECIGIIVVDTEEAWFADQIAVSPNPTSGAIRLTLGDLDKVNVKILDLTGKILLERHDLRGGSEDLYIDGPVGLYFVGVTIEGETAWIKVVKGN